MRHPSRCSLTIRLTYISILILLSIGTVAQDYVFTPAPIDSIQLINLKGGFEKIYKHEIANLPPENKKELAEVYKQRWEFVKEKFDKKEIYTSVSAQQYLDAMVAEIVKSNPVLQANPFHCYFSRSGAPNASYIGEGIILFNMGLFNKLENESQAAFVICHEISHFLLKHSEKSINKYIATLNSDQVQKQLRKIKSTEFSKREQLDKLINEVSFGTRRHSRTQESEADSMAIELMRHTNFPLREALTTLDLFDSIDVEPLKTELCLQSMFNSPDYPFQKKWIAKEEGLLGGHATIQEDKTLVDSLKTHPDCQLRIRLLDPMVKKYQVNGISKELNSAKFKDLQHIFRYEVVEFAYRSGNYTRSLQYAMGLLQNNPSDAYLVTLVGKIFNGFYLADKTHTLSKLIDLPSPFIDTNYNLLLQFVQNLYRENYVAISYHYLKQFKEQLNYYKPYQVTLNISSELYKQ